MSTPRLGSKRIIFVRHAQALHNLLLSKGKRDEGQNCRDARVTPKGEEEAAALKAELSVVDKVDVVITSPLTRAMQTALLLFPAGARIEACALITEKVNPAQADMGRPPVVLKTEFPTIHNLDDLPEEWWPDPGLMGESNESVRERGERFIDALLQRPEHETVFVVVTHCAFLKELTGVSLRNAGFTDFTLFCVDEAAANPLPGYFGRFIHTAWASYGGKPASIYENAVLYCCRDVTLSSECVVLTGFVSPTAVDSMAWRHGDVIGTLPFPAQTAPSQPQSFCALAKPLDEDGQELQAVMIDVYPNGHIVFRGGCGPFTKGSVSLTGIQYCRKELHPLVLLDTIVSDARFASPSYSVVSAAQASGTSPMGVVGEYRFACLSGRVARADHKPFAYGDIIGFIPETACLGNSSFATIGSSGLPARIDVMCDGRIVYRGGGVLDHSIPASVAIAQPRHFWVTLSGLIVPLKPPSGPRGALSPAMFGQPGIVCGRGFGAYFGPTVPVETRRPYDPPAESVAPRVFQLDSGLVVFVGFIEKHGRAQWHKGDNVAVIDERFRPTVRAVFHVIGQSNQMVRLDVLPDGRVLYVGCDAPKAQFTPESGWVSLNGIQYFPCRHDVSFFATLAPSPISVSPTAYSVRPAALAVSVQDETSASICAQAELWKWQFLPALYPPNAASRNPAYDDSTAQEGVVMAKPVVSMAAVDVYRVPSRAGSPVQGSPVGPQPPPKIPQYSRMRPASIGVNERTPTRAATEISPIIGTAADFSFEATPVSYFGGTPPLPPPPPLHQHSQQHSVGRPFLKSQSEGRGHTGAMYRHAYGEYGGLPAYADGRSVSSAGSSYSSHSDERYRVASLTSRHLPPTIPHMDAGGYPHYVDMNVSGIRGRSGSNVSSLSGGSSSGVSMAHNSSPGRVGEGSIWGGGLGLGLMIGAPLPGVAPVGTRLPSPDSQSYLKSDGSLFPSAPPVSTTPLVFPRVVNPLEDFPPPPTVTVYSDSDSLADTSSVSTSVSAALAASVTPALSLFAMTSPVDIHKHSHEPPSSGPSWYMPRQQGSDTNTRQQYRG